MEWHCQERTEFSRTKIVRVEAIEMDALTRFSRISRKWRIRSVNIRQQIGLEILIIIEIEQNQLTWHGHVQRMAEGRLHKIALKWMPKQKRTRGRPKKNWMEGIRKTMNERNLNEGQWEDRKQWSLGVGQRRTAFRNRHTYIEKCPNSASSNTGLTWTDLVSKYDLWSDGTSTNRLYRVTSDVVKCKSCMSNPFSKYTQTNRLSCIGK